MTDEQDKKGAQIAHDARWMTDPIAVEREDLHRIGDALGEISQNLIHIRKEWGDVEEIKWMFEAIVESVGLLHRMERKCFMPDPKRDENEEEAES